MLNIYIIAPNRQNCVPNSTAVAHGDRYRDRWQQRETETETDSAGLGKPEGHPIKEEVER